MSFTITKSPMLLLTLCLTTAGLPNLAHGTQKKDAQQQVKLYFGSLTKDSSASSSGKNSCDVSKVQLNVDRVDYLTQKGWYSSQSGQSVDFSKDQDDSAGSCSLGDAKGISQIRIVLNKNKCGRIHDNRGHECKIVDPYFLVKFKKGLNFANYENNKLKVFMDLRQSAFEYKKDGSCVFKPKFKVVHAGHNKKCLEANEDQERQCNGKHKGYSKDRKHTPDPRGWAYGLYKQKHRHACWDRDEQDESLGDQCQQHGDIPVDDGSSTPAPTPTPSPSPSPSPTPEVTPTPSPTPSDSSSGSSDSSSDSSSDGTDTSTTPSTGDVTSPSGDSSTGSGSTDSGSSSGSSSGSTDSGSTTTTPTTPVVAGPVISNFALAERYSDSVSVKWTTDVASTSQVIVTNMSTGVQTVTTLDSTAATSHFVYVLDLSPGVTYELQAVSTANSVSTTSSAIYVTVSQ